MKREQFTSLGAWGWVVRHRGLPVSFGDLLLALEPRTASRCCSAICLLPCLLYDLVVVFYLTGGPSEKIVHPAVAKNLKVGYLDARSAKWAKCSGAIAATSPRLWIPRAQTLASGKKNTPTKRGNGRERTRIGCGKMQTSSASVSRQSVLGARQSGGLQVFHRGDGTGQQPNWT